MYESLSNIIENEVLVVLEFKFGKSLFGDNPESLKAQTFTAIVSLFASKLTYILLSNFDNGG